MATVYSWLKISDAVSALQGQLGSTGFWGAAECQAYITMALREWSALTEQWKEPFTFTTNSATTWYNTGTLANSPRLRTVKDSDIYTVMQYMLLENPTGAGTWTGTSQFKLSDLQSALQNRVQVVIQASGCNLALLSPLASTPGTYRTLLADTVLEPRRIRFVPATGQGNPITLTREDTQAFQFFEAGYLGAEPSAFGPVSWSVASEPPLAFDVDAAPNVPGTYDVIALNAGPTFAPPASSLLGVPNDWAYLAMWGALGDLLASGEEKKDVARSNYCMKRFEDGLKIMQKSNWMLQGNINGIPCDTPSMAEADLYSPEWQNNSSAWPCLIQAGIDLIGICPTGAAGVNITLVGNAPILDSTNTYLQVSRDDWESVLGYAQRLGSFKQSGDSFTATESLEQDFYRAAQATNARLMDMGIFTELLHSEGRRQDENQPRFAQDQAAILKQNQNAILRALGA